MSNNGVLLRLDHIGYAVSSISAYTSENTIFEKHGNSWTDPVYDPIQQVKVSFLQFGSSPGNPSIELVEPVGDTSPASRFVKAGQTGLYHVCYEVSAVESAIESLRSDGWIPVSGPYPAVAFGGRQIAFMLNRSMDLVELLETH